MRLRFELDTGKAEERPVTVFNNTPAEIVSHEAVAPLVDSTRVKEIPADPSLKEAAWEKVREGRQKWLDGIKDEDIVVNDRRNYWIGGAIAVYCAFTGEDPAVAHNRILKEMPQPGHDNSTLAPGELPAQPALRTRAEPHPGAQRIVTEEDPTLEPAESSIPEWDPGEEEEPPLQGGIVDATGLHLIGESTPEIPAGATEEDVDEDVRSAMLKGVETVSLKDAVVPPRTPEKATPPEVSITKIVDRS